MNNNQNRLINTNPHEQKLIETFISAFTVIMSKEENLGVNMASLTLAIVDDKPFENALNAFDESNPLQKKAKEILLQLRELNKKPINTALTALIISRIKVNLSLKKQDGSAEKKAQMKIGF